MLTCPECGKPCKTPQGLRGHQYFAHGLGKKYSEARRGVGPPEPEERVFAQKPSVDELYKPTQPWPSVAQPAQYAQPYVRPYAQPYPQQPQPPQPQQPPPQPPHVRDEDLHHLPEEAVTKTDLIRALAGLSKTREPQLTKTDIERIAEEKAMQVQAPPKKAKTDIRELFQKALETPKEESIYTTAAKFLAEVPARLEEALKKAYEKAQAQPAQPEAPLLQQPGEPSPRPPPQHVARPEAPTSAQAQPEVVPVSETQAQPISRWEIEQMVEEAFRKNVTDPIRKLIENEGGAKEKKPDINIPREAPAPGGEEAPVTAETPDETGVTGVTERPPQPILPWRRFRRFRLFE